MRKIISYIITLTLFLLFPLTLTKAITKVQFSEESNGVIKTSVHFDEGFVGGIDLVLKLSKDIEVKNFTFNDNFNDCTKNYKFDNNNHTLTIKIASGGIGTSHNLLNEKKELALGNMTLKTSKKESFEYTLDINSIKFVDNNWDSITLKKDEYELKGENKFKYNIGSTSNKEDDKKPEENKNDNSNSDNKVDSNNSSNTNNSNDSKDSNNSSNKNINVDSDSKSDTVKENTKNNENSKSSTDNTNKEESKDAKENVENVITKDEENDKEINSSTKNTEDKESKKDKSNTKRNSLIAIISILGIGVIISAIVLIIKRKKNKDIIKF